jgi:predicted nucleic acid-binding protein
MTVVLDTNVVLQARAAGHPYHVILEAWLAGRFALAVSTARIVTEDAHFEVLKHSGHKPKPITPEAFIRDVLGKG